MSYRRKPQKNSSEAAEEPGSSKQAESKEETSESEQTSEKDSVSAASAQPPITNAQWWRAKEIDRKPHEILDGIVKKIEDDQKGRYEAYREYERLWGSTVSATGDTSYRDIATDELSQNELQNTLETLWAQVFKNRIVPAVSVSEADWDEWSRAKDFSRWLEGAFDDTKVAEKVFPKAGAYSLCHGTGIIRVGWREIDDKTAEVYSWAVNPRYFSVDRFEGKHGKPRSIFFKDHIDRWLLWETYKDNDGDGDDKCFYGTPEERRKGIATCQSNDDTDLGATDFNNCDMLTVREAFHLPSGPKSKDGRHVIWIRGCTLLDEEFTWDTHPAVFMRFGVPMEGFYGESAVKRLAPTQKNLDKLNLKIDEAQDIMGVPRIIIGNGAGLKVEHVDDIPGGILSVNNVNQVKDWNAQCVTPELYEDRDNAGHKMRGLLGISDFEAQQQMPNGMRDISGAFLERWVDQGQARHAMFHREYETAVVELADLYMRQAEECQSYGYDVVVKAPSDSTDRDSMESLSFKNVHVDRKRLKLKVQPMSDLPQTFAGKVDAIGKLRNEAGVNLDPKTVLRMIRVPDVDGTTGMMVSDEEIIMKNLTHMTKHAKYVSPLPFDNLDLIVQMTTRYINRYRVRDDSDNEVVGLLAQYIDDAIALKRGLGSPDPNAPPPSTLAAVMGQPGTIPGVSPPGMGAPAPIGPMGAPLGPMPPGGPAPMQMPPQAGMGPAGPMGVPGPGGPMQAPGIPQGMPQSMQ